MELPPYRVPMLKGLLIHMWDRSKIFLRKMGGVILIGSLVIWVLSSFPREARFSKDYESEIAAVSERYGISMAEVQGELREKLVRERDRAVSVLEAEKAKEKVEHSYIGHIGKALAPVFAPLGMDWRASVAILSGFVAKEIVVSTLGVLHAVGADETEKSEALKLALKKSGMTPLSAYAMMAFVLIYIPCLATVSVIRRETNSWKWTIFSIAYSTILAWGVAFLIYQGGKGIGLA
jgi:ferrous iron transport protein B